MIYIAEVHAPDLVPPPGLLEAVELAVDGEDASTGARTQVNVQLLQRRRDAKLAELGVLLKLPHLVHRPKVHLAHAFAGLVLQAVYAFGDPLLQRSVDGGATGLQIAGDAFDVPALGVQHHDGQTALFGLFYLVDPHRGVLGLEVQDEPADFRVQSAAPRGGLLCPEQAAHAFVLKADDPAAESRFRGSGLAGPLGHGAAEDDRGRIRSYSTCSGHFRSSLSCPQSSVGSTRVRLAICRSPPATPFLLPPASSFPSPRADVAISSGSSHSSSVFRGDRMPRQWTRGKFPPPTIQICVTSLWRGL